MKSLRSLSWLLALGLIGFAASPLLADKEIDLDDVPAKVREAAEAAVKGITLTEAEVEEEDGKVVYELEGVVDGKEYEIEVDEDGKVLEVEVEDDDDDDDDDD